MKAPKSVLIVDDNHEIRNTLAELLLRKGFEIGIAENGMEALKIFIDKSFDVVLTDFRMPYMDGHMLASEIKKKQPKTIIVMMSGDRQMSLLAKDITDYFLAKPFGIRELYNLMNGAFESEAQKQSPQVDQAR